MDKVTLRIRKPVDQLTLEDFATFPIWEYADDEEGIEGRDETWVRPVDSSIVPKRSYTHVAVHFTSACGKQFRGFVTVSTLKGPPNACQGVILHNREYLCVSNLEPGGFDESRKSLLAVLRLTEAEVFPLSFRLLVPIAGRAKYSGGMLM